MKLIEELKFLDKVLELGGIEDAHRLIVGLIKKYGANATTSGLSKS